jgi:hypothetical protein
VEDSPGEAVADDCDIDALRTRVSHGDSQSHPANDHTLRSVTPAGHSGRSHCSVTYGAHVRIGRLSADNQSFAKSNTKGPRRPAAATLNVSLRER